MTFALTWLADILRTNGLKVIEVDGWKSRGRGEMGDVKGVLCHHTAGPRLGNTPSLSVIVNGRKDLPGPLSQLFLARDGTWHVVAAGRCNHAGWGEWNGVTAGNSQFIGIEAENTGDGTDPWQEAQIDSYARGVAAILTHIDAPPIMCAGHKEYALPRGRKIDPSFDMVAFRDRVRHYIGTVQVVPMPVPATNPRDTMLRSGMSGADVRSLQDKLGIHADGNFGPNTKAAVIAFQQSNGLAADGLVGPATWAALGVTNEA